MTEHYRLFPTPPSNVPLQVERLSDRLVVTIKRDRAVARAVLARRIPSGILTFWTIVRYGAHPTFVMVLAMTLLFLWFGTRTADVQMRWTAFALAGLMLLYTALIVLWIRRSTSAPVILWTGRFSWRLELSNDRWRVVWQKFPFGESAYTVSRSAVTRVCTDAAGKVIAYEGDQRMILSPPMLPELSAWLSDALADQVGPHVLHDVAEDEAKFYTPS